MGNTKENIGLKKSLSGKSLFAIGLGCVVGWSWLIYGGIWSTAGGSLGGIIAFVIIGILCSLVGMVYAELTSAFPKVGGDVVFVLEGIGTKASIAMMWLLVIFWVGLLMVETMFFPLLLATLGFPLPEWVPLFDFAGGTVYLSYALVSLGVNGLLAFLNSRSVKISGKVQQWSVWIMLVAVAFFCFSGIIKGDVSNMQPLFTGTAGFTMVLLMLPGFMAGFNAIPQAAEEANTSPKIIGRAVVLTVWGAVLFYVMIVFGSSMGADAAVRSGEGLVVLDVVRNLYSNSAGINFFITFAALLGMITTWNAAYIASSRLLVGLSRAKYLPKSLSVLNEKTKAPTKAIIILWATSSLIIFFGTSMAVLVAIVNVFSLSLIIAWLLVTISYLRLNKNRPDMARPYKLKHPKLVGWAAMVISIAFLYLYTPLGPAGLAPGEWIGVLVIVVLALIVYFVYNRRNSISIEERRKLLGLKEDNSTIKESSKEPKDLT